jgi:hypothetical protein
VVYLGRAMSGLKNGIHRAETEEEKRVVYRFRYEV